MFSVGDDFHESAYSIKSLIQPRPTLKFYVVKEMFCYAMVNTALLFFIRLYSFENKHEKILRIGHIDLSFHTASAALVCTVFEKYGWEVEMTASPHEDMFKCYGKGQVDMLVSAWLPASHDVYLAPYRNKVVKLTVLYHPYCIWGIPDYIPVSDMASVKDLLIPDVLMKMEKRILGINPGAGISRFSRTMVGEYQLTRSGYYLENGSQAAC